MWGVTRSDRRGLLKQQLKQNKTEDFKNHKAQIVSVGVFLTAIGLTHVFGVTLERLLSATSGSRHPCRLFCCNRSRTCNVSIRRGILPANSFSSVRTSCCCKDIEIKRNKNKNKAGTNPPRQISWFEFCVFFDKKLSSCGLFSRRLPPPETRGRG